MNRWPLKAALAANEGRAAPPVRIFFWRGKAFWFKLKTAGFGWRGPLGNAPRGSRRVLEQQSAQRARGQPQQQPPEQSQQQSGFSVELRVPHLFSTAMAQAGVALSAGLLRALQPLAALETPPALTADHGLRSEAHYIRWRRWAPAARAFL
jgi:hypothetical protein